MSPFNPQGRSYSFRDTNDEVRFWDTLYIPLNSRIYNEFSKLGISFQGFLKIIQVFFNSFESLLLAGSRIQSCGVTPFNAENLYRGFYELTGDIAGAEFSYLGK